MKSKEPVTEWTAEEFLADPFDKQFCDYAKFVTYCFMRNQNMSTLLNRGRISMEDFVDDIVNDTIERCVQGILDGKLRKYETDAVKKFIWFKVRTAYHNKVRQIKCIPSLVNAEQNSVMEKVDAQLKLKSIENDTVVDDNLKQKIEYANYIRRLVGEMSKRDQELFNLKFGFNLTPADYALMAEIKHKSHVKDPFAGMAAAKYHLSENYARKRICEILSEIKRILDKDGITVGSYKTNTSMPAFTEFKISKDTMNPSNHNQETLCCLSDEDCLDILDILSYYPF